MNNIQYVVSYAYVVSEGPMMIPLIEKQKPEHLVGMLNLPGGKVNPGEDLVDAAVRELLEETGLEPVEEGCIGPEYMGRIDGTTCQIHHVKIPVVYQELKPGPDEIEKVDWYKLPELLSISNLMPNLRVTIPLCYKGLKGWVVEDFDGNWRKKAYHSVTLYMDVQKSSRLNPWNVQVRSVGHYRWEEEEE